MWSRALGPVGFLAILSSPVTGCLVVGSEDTLACEIKCGGECVTAREVCDQVADCPDGRDEARSLCYPPVFQELLIVDACDDSTDVTWRVWATEREWVWPSQESSFYSAGFLYQTYELIECEVGEELCFGALAGPISWGVGVDGEVGCEGCCWTCANDLVDLGLLTCD